MQWTMNNCQCIGQKNWQLANITFFGDAGTGLGNKCSYLAGYIERCRLIAGVLSSPSGAAPSVVGIQQIFLSKELRNCKKLNLLPSFVQVLSYLANQVPNFHQLRNEGAHMISVIGVGTQIATSHL